jgi:hypothetical protein
MTRKRRRLMLPGLAALGTAFPEDSLERAAIKQRISQLPVPERPHGRTLLP